jgi:hypothetical protein
MLNDFGFEFLDAFNGALSLNTKKLKSTLKKSHVLRKMLLIAATLEILKTDRLLELHDELVKQFNWFAEETLILAVQFAIDLEKGDLFLADWAKLLDRRSSSLGIYKL